MLARAVAAASLIVALAFLAARLHGDDHPAAKEAAGRERAGLDSAGLNARGFNWRWAVNHARPQASRSAGGNWSPAGGLATLLFTVKPAAKTLVNRLAPVVRDAASLEADLRHAIKANAPASPTHRAQRESGGIIAETQSADAPKPGTLLSDLNFFFRFFDFKPDAASTLLASNPRTAVYDISTRTVYMPDGRKLEAHSGFGAFLDDPSSVARRDLGPTPPNIYKLSLRPAPFHGVQALRMTPAGDGNMFGRDGFLAHPYMLGDDGASNGCLSLRNYEAFLQAYQAGEVKRVIVLPRLDAQPARLARAEPALR